MRATEQLKKLYDAAIAEGKGFGAYRQAMRTAMGVSLNEQTGNLQKDAQGQLLDPKAISLQELAFEFMGRDYQSRLLERNQMFREGLDGGPVTPGALAAINGFDASVFGLLDAFVLEGYNLPEFIGDQVVDVQATRTNGGKSIRPYLESDPGVNNLAVGQEAPSIGMTAGYVVRPDNVRRGCKCQVLLESVLYDTTSEVQNEAMACGKFVAYQRETDIAQVAMGVTNPYNRDGTTGNTYLTAKGSGVMAYKNAEANALTTYEAIQTALNTMADNDDPYTGLPIWVSPTDALIVVPYSQVMRTRTILRATMVREMNLRADVSATYPAMVRESSNPIEQDFTLLASPIWDRVATAGSLTTRSWHLINGKRAFAYRQLVPFTTVSMPLSPKEIASNVVLSVYAQEYGKAMVTEPRHAYAGTTS